MSISEIQKRRIFEEVTRLFYATGENPRLVDILNEISEYFSAYPAGTALPIPQEYLESGVRSDVDKMNEIFANTSMNIDVMYDASTEQVRDLMMLTTLLRTHIERLRSRRKRLETQVDDYLFSLYNTDGYYFSASDTFADVTLTDLGLTSAFVDTVTGSVTLPTISSGTRRIPPERISLSALSVTHNGQKVIHETKFSFAGAIDSLTNTAWSIEVPSSQPKELIVVIGLNVGSNENPAKVSRIEIDPFGITAVQAFVEVIRTGANTNPQDFGNKIQTSSSKMVFIDSAQDIRQVRITLRKTQPDYVVNENNVIKYRYIFGAKDIAITEHVYDSDAVFVSQPLKIADDLADDNVIDAVALVVRDEVPAGTSIKYFVAPDVDSDDPTMGDFNWSPIEPLVEGTEDGGHVVKFDGALTQVKYIKENPLSTELQLIPLNDSTSDATLANPSPYIMDGVDRIYRIAKFNEAVLPESMLLEEGINTVRIIHTDLDEDATEDLSFWTPFINGTTSTPHEIVYSTIDTGNEFFYGGDVGDIARSVYVETYVESLTEQELVLKQFRKADINSELWNVHVFLNGRSVGNLPVGTDNMIIPWKFQQGLNHICILINIPADTVAHPHPYIGTLDLMKDEDLDDYGNVKLGTWSYVDPFHMRHNETAQDKIKTFTIVNNEIVSRQKPTSNFRLKYSTRTNSGPEAVRVRADLTRSLLNPHIAPSIESYRLRFLYGN